MIDYNKMAGEYARLRQIHPGVFRNLVENGPVTKDRSVLDVGCGTGNYLVALARATGCKGFGIDPSGEMLAKARVQAEAAEALAQGAGAGLALSFRVGSAQTLEFPDACFDLVFSTDVIHHVHKSGGCPAYYREAYRVLLPGGKVSTVTDSEWVIRHRKPLTYYFPETLEKELLRYPSMGTLRAMMEEAGFSGITEDLEEFEYDLTDIQPYREKVFSSLHLIAEDAWRRGLDRMEQDLERGPIRCTARYTVLWGVKPHSRTEDTR
ncbi:MAG: class I SAM-dependent methyltransferase [Bacillota bacterium]